MRKWLCLGMWLMLVLAFCACTGVNSENDITTQPTSEVSTTEATIEEVTAPTTVEETEPTEPEHSPLYLPGYTVEQVVEYFEEVVLDAEYTDGTGNFSLVQKWIDPIWYDICGTPTEEDLSVLTALFDELNAIPGFPGIYAVEEGVPCNFTIHFLDSEEFNRSFQTILNGEDACGAAQFWYYNDTNEIYTADVGYRTEIDQSIRNSVLLEEIINMLGISDTVLRTDSIVYQYSDDNTALSDMDWLIMKLLYHPDIQCGMNLDDCRTVIQELYD